MEPTDALMISNIVMASCLGGVTIISVLALALRPLFTPEARRERREARREQEETERQRLQDEMELKRLEQTRVEHTGSTAATGGSGESPRREQPTGPGGTVGASTPTGRDRERTPTS